MNPISTALRKFYEDPKYISILTLTAAILIFYPTTYYAFSPYFLWTITFNYYYQKNYLFYMNYNVVSPGDFAIKVLIFTIILSATVIASIRISQILTKKIVESTELIRQWKTNKKITSTALILQYLTLIALIALAFLIWYNILQQYASTFLTLARYAVTIISALGILYLIHPTLDDEETLAQACLNIIKDIKEGYEKEDIKKIELAHFMLYILLNHALSKDIKELKEFNLEPHLTTLYLAFLQNEKESLTKAKTITTNLLKVIIQHKTQDILKHLNQIEEKLVDDQKLAKTMEININYPSLAIYTFNSSKRITRFKTIIPLITQIPLVILIFLEKWLYYITT